tara:strand:+ start:403 stop:1974 length:1572 start_codon:yes stop_codon:yes gene_type:complete
VKKAELNNDISLPPRGEYSSITGKARDQFEDYFIRYIDNQTSDIYLLDYIKKLMSPKYLHYFALNESVNKKLSESEISIILSNSFFNRISKDLPPKYNFNLCLFYPLYLYSLLKFCVRSSILSIRSNNRIEIPKVLFLRKKDYPDLGISQILGDNILAKGVSFTSTIWGFSRRPADSGFNYLNFYKGAFVNVVTSFLATLLFSLQWFGFIVRNGIPHTLFPRLLIDSLVANVVCRMRSRIITGVLVDKPFYVLLYRYKKDYQKIVSLNESFWYPPFRSFDYNHLDIYYSMCNIDASTINQCGGNIKKFINTEFYRHELVTNSNGISYDLKLPLCEYDYKILVAPIQVPIDRFLPWSPKELEKFILCIIQLSIEMTDTLFVLKEKKDELKLLDESVINSIYSRNNIYTIRSEKPRYLKYNQFEDLICKMDQLVSMSHMSTTIWQAISQGIRTIAVNDIHPQTFLSDYKNLEVKLENLGIAIQYWKEMPDKQWGSLRANISKRVNLGASNGLEKVASDICAMIQN